jgi:hypothetical protein
MKNYLSPIITGCVMCILGFFLGYRVAKGPDMPGIDESSLPRKNGKIDSSMIKALTYDELENVFREKEIEIITQLLVIKGQIETRKEGNVLKREVVNYLKGTIFNNAHILTIKDIEIKVEFYSQNGTLVDEETIVLFDYAEPLNVTEYEAKIKVPDEYNSIKIKILDAKPAEKEFKEYNAIE